MMSCAWRTGTAGADAAAVVLGLGTNMGDRRAQLRAAIDGIGAFGTVEALSRVYESEPYGFTDQPRFLNMAMRMRTDLAPAALLRAVKDLEVQIGRTPSWPMGPRAIDIDVLLYGESQIDEPGLTVPHRGIMERPFVLAPLLDLDPDSLHPVSHVRLADRLAQIGDTSLVPLGTAADVLGLNDVADESLT